MNIALITNSKSGNTAQLAQALREAFAVSDVQLVCDVELPDAPDAAQLEDAAGQALLADAVCVGFWCDKGSCTEGVAKLLERMDGKRVFLFGTCGFGGSQEYFDQIIERVKEHLPQTAELAGAFMCQGKMGSGVRARYEAMLAKNPTDARAQALIDNFDLALAHPDAEDLKAAASLAARALNL